jgi:signal transduction histidine kinase
MNFLIVGLILGWLTLAAAAALYSRLHQWRQTRHYGEALDHSALLAKFGRKLMNAQDSSALAELLTKDLPHVLHVQHVRLLLPENHQFIDTEDGKLILPVSHAAVRWVASAGDAQRADKGHLLELIQQRRTDLSWTHVWIPLMRGTGLRGLWLLGGRGNDLHFSPEDLRWLTALAREAAAVLDTIQYSERERLASSEIRTLYQDVVKSRETERGRLSRELHDGVLQDLCAVVRDLKSLEAQDESGRQIFSDLTGRSGEAVNALRRICNDLRPPLLQQDFTSALKALVSNMDARSSAPIQIEITAEVERMVISGETALAIFRITQEALNNALQHADASEIAVRLTQYPNLLRLTITDDGRGITGSADSARFVAAGHFGLAGMRERAAMIGGKLDVQTAVDYGTVVILELPLRSE